jgi:hypothetical protein
MATNWPGSRDTFTNPTSGDTLDSPSHAAQHANINDAVEAMQLYAGLILVKTQTIGTAVSSVTVSDAFSSTFENYRIVVSGVTASAGGSVPRLRLGTTSTGYYNGMFLQPFTGATASLQVNNGGDWYILVGSTTTGSMSVSIDVYQPNLATVTTHIAHGTYGGNTFFTGGYQSATTQFTSFRIAPDSGTITGGTIRVYGYNNG